MVPRRGVTEIRGARMAKANFVRVAFSQGWENAGVPGEAPCPPRTLGAVVEGGCYEGDGADEVVEGVEGYWDPEVAGVGVNEGVDQAEGGEGGEEDEVAVDGAEQDRGDEGASDDAEARCERAEEQAAEDAIFDDGGEKHHRGDADADADRRHRRDAGDHVEMFEPALHVFRLVREDELDAEGDAGEQQRGEAD